MLGLVQEVDDLLFVALGPLDHLPVEQLVELLVFALEVINDFLELYELLLHCFGLIGNLLRLVQFDLLLLDDGHELLILVGSLVQLLAQVELLLINLRELRLVTALQLIILALNLPDFVLLVGRGLLCFQIFRPLIAKLIS